MFCLGHKIYVEYCKKEMSRCLESLAEMANIPAPSSDEVDEIMSGIDTNNDSTVSVEEFKSLVFEVFSAILLGLEGEGQE